MTYRPLNTCKTCGHDWYPRGHDLSARCPECYSNNVKIIDLSWMYVVFIGLIIGLGWFAHQDNKQWRESQTDSHVLSTSYTNSDGNSNCWVKIPHPLSSGDSYNYFYVPPAGMDLNKLQVHNNGYPLGNQPAPDTMCNYTPNWQSLQIGQRTSGGKGLEKGYFIDSQGTHYIEYWQGTKNTWNVGGPWLAK